MRVPGNSIRWRLMVVGVATLAAALMMAGYGLAHLFERHVERRVMAELETDTRQLMSGLGVDAEGVASVSRPPGDQRYAQTFSGKYWQVESGEEIVAKSRSLWDERLQLPEDALATGEVHRHRILGPRGRPLLAVERRIVVERAGKTSNLCVAAAVDSSDVTEAVRAFRNDLATALSFLGVLLLGAFAAAVHFGLTPLDRLREALKNLRAGDERRLEGRFPDELSPLVDDLNRVLDQRSRMARQAKTRAADLAHGLKTPLTAIEVMADELRGKGEGSLGAELSDYVAAMQRHVERELALARSSVSGEPAREVQLDAAVGQLVHSLRRLSGGKTIDWQIAVSPDLRAKIDETLLTEVLGNLLDNARKWAASRVRVTAARMPGAVEIRVEDDGPGVAADEVDIVLRRGRRLDESVPGSGFGLAIVCDMLDLVGGRISLARSSLGGLDVRVVVPVQS